jgi:two-component system chemotaxis response regulator CheB
MRLNQKKIKVLIIDDSAFIRKVFTEELNRAPDIEVVGTAQDPYEGRDKIVRLTPDVLILDVEVPRMDGLTFLGVLMKHYPMPVIVVSALGESGGEVAMKAYELGAVDVIAKPGMHVIREMCAQLVERIRAYAHIPMHKIVQMPKSQGAQPVMRPLHKAANKIIAIGASTGGTEAIKEILTRLPPNMPPIMITQHMPEHFTKTFSERLNQICPLIVKEAEDNEPMAYGKVLIAPGNYHLTLSRVGDAYYVRVKDGPKVFHQRPSVDVMFDSVARSAGSDAIGVILTGMGKDGAKGLLAMKNAGALTLAQDEKSCVVYGMPHEAALLGAVTRVVPLEMMAETILSIIG